MFKLFDSVFRHRWSQKSLCQWLAESRTTVLKLVCKIGLDSIGKNFIELIEFVSLMGFGKWCECLIVFEFIDKGFFGGVKMRLFEKFVLWMEMHSKWYSNKIKYYFRFGIGLEIEPNFKNLLSAFWLLKINDIQKLTTTQVYGIH